jgi:PPOX class probable F420-dependent enzyme
MIAIPEKYLDLLQKPAFAHLATLMPDGSPQVTPVWIGYDGAYLIVNTARGRQKDRNMTRNAHVAVEISDPEDPYRYFTVRGHVAEVVEQGADDSIDELALKYTGEKYKGHVPGQTRVIYKIAPDHVSPK